MLPIKVLFLIFNSFIYEQWANSTLCYIIICRSLGSKTIKWKNMNLHSIILHRISLNKALLNLWVLSRIYYRIYRLWSWRKCTKQKVMSQSADFYYHWLKYDHPIRKRLRTFMSNTGILNTLKPRHNGRFFTNCSLNEFSWMKNYVFCTELYLLPRF